MRINHNMNSMYATRALSINNNARMHSMEKLTLGVRVQRAGDDAAGLSISEKMRGQIKGLQQASRNAEDGISLIQTAEGALGETHALLQRMRELTVQAANDTNVTADRDAIKAEVEQLTAEVDRIANDTEFNTQKMLNTAYSADFQVGANSGQTVKLTINDMRAAALGADAIQNNVTANQSIAIRLSDDAIIAVSEERAKLGALQVRLEHTIRNADNGSTNLQAAESRIRDVDMATEMANFTKLGILIQSTQSMLAQSNQQPQSVLQLLN